MNRPRRPRETSPATVTAASDRTQKICIIGARGLGPLRRWRRSSNRQPGIPWAPPDRVVAQGFLSGSTGRVKSTRNAWPDAWRPTHSEPHLHREAIGTRPGRKRRGDTQAPLPVLADLALQRGEVPYRELGRDRENARRQCRELIRPAARGAAPRRRRGWSPAPASAGRTWRSRGQSGHRPSSPAEGPRSRPVAAITKLAPCWFPS